MINVVEIGKVYIHPHEVTALDGVSLEIGKGESVAITGPSGCGKSTLLHCLGGLDTPTRGTITVDGQRISGLPDTRISRYRRETVGFVFQFFNLLPTLSLEDNVILPALLDGKSGPGPQARARELLERVGLGERRHHRPHQVSGGQLQRASIARALMMDPKVILADEPTGNLDSEAAAKVLDMLYGLCRDEERTLVVVTHSKDVAERSDREVRMRDGKIEN
jgi:putative ABC transport system ATP-binding protein